MELFQGRDDVDEVVSLSLVHFDLANASMLICLGDHPLCLSKFRLVHLKKADRSCRMLCPGPTWRW